MLILSIPFLNSEFVREKSTDQKFTWKEYRLDYQQQLDAFPLDILDSGSIVTIRDIDEGGQNKFSEDERLHFYRKVITEYNCLVDLELRYYKSDIINPNNLILSYHDFSAQIDFVKLEEIIQKMNETESKFVKFAVNVNSYTELLKIQELISKSNKPVIFTGMGKLGKISRLLYKHLGAAGTFIGLNENPTATGQITENEVDLYGFHKISSRSRLGGIIGGKHIQHSLGIKFYNEYFHNHALDAFYFPFIIDDFSEFNNWFQSSGFKNKFYGFSITMPFKKSLTQKPSNLYLTQENLLLNTDAEAFRKSFELLEIKLNNSILVFGSGGSVETALSFLKDHKNVIVCARNEKSGKNIEIEFLREFQNIKQIQNAAIDLVINCTPIGMNGEDFIIETGIANFKKVIDLPYQTENTMLIDFCMKNSIPFVDGKMFWQWQAETQLNKFLGKIK
ncbi:type I 3-dehydroquinate dehydratase [Candidatus Cloacimonadota bacterium]